MPLSPREEEALATLEAELRATDPALAAALDSEQPPRSSLLVPTRNALFALVALVAALLGLITASTLLGDRLGPAATGALTLAMLVPWFVVATRVAGRPGSTAWVRRRGSAGLRRGRPTGPGAVFTGAVLILSALAVLPPTGRAVVGLVFTLFLFPWFVLRALERLDRNDRTKRRRERGTGPET